MSDAALQGDNSSPETIDEGSLRAFFDLSLDLFCVAGFDGYFIHLNPAWERTLGFSRDELCAAPFTEWIHPDDLESSIAEARRVAEGSETVQFVDRYRTAWGEYRWLSWTATPLVDQGKLMAVARDITTDRNREMQLQASEARFRSLVESAPGGILIVDAAGRISVSNQHVQELFGYSGDELDGATVEMLVPEGMRDHHVDLRKEYAAVPVPRLMGGPYVLAARRRDGSEFPASIGLAPLPGEAGTVAATITDMTKQHLFEEELRVTNEELQSRIEDLQELGREADLTSEMAEMLQASQTDEEAHRVVELFARRLFIWGSGAVGLINESRNHVEHVAEWGTAGPGEAVFDPQDCWAMRRGRPHLASRDDSLGCAHLAGVDSELSLCVPLLAQGAAIGVLTKVCKPGGYDKWGRIQRLATTFADHLALALANLRLRSTLRTQSIRDPLTGLFNRRYLEESMEREAARTKRHQTSMGVVMLDLDNFKRFNDTYGHRAGDAALVEVGALLPRLIRAEDIPCRYGGEEFALILPDATAEQTAARADDIRQALAGITLIHAGDSLGHITLSAGVAALPAHGETIEDVLQAADRALYRAKELGRNQVVVAS